MNSTTKSVQSACLAIDLMAVFSLGIMTCLSLFVTASGNPANLFAILVLISINVMAFGATLTAKNAIAKITDMLKEKDMLPKVKVPYAALCVYFIICMIAGYFIISQAVNIGKFIQVLIAVQLVLLIMLQEEKYKLKRYAELADELTELVYKLSREEGSNDGN